MTKESAARIPPDNLLAFPIYHNPLFRIRKQLQEEWTAHPQPARVDTVLTEKGNNRTTENINQIIKEMVPNINAQSRKKLISHAKSIQKRIPTWFKRRLHQDRKWSENEIVKFKDNLNDDQYGLLKSNQLFELRINATGHGLPISTP
eukprot:2171690-Pleurochrysis_carterae.AAC.1